MFIWFSNKDEMLQKYYRVTICWSRFNFIFFIPLGIPFLPLQELSIDLGKHNQKISVRINNIGLIFSYYFVEKPVQKK